MSFVYKWIDKYIKALLNCSNPVHGSQTVQIIEMIDKNTLIISDGSYFIKAKLVKKQTEKLIPSIFINIEEFTLEYKKDAYYILIYSFIVISGVSDILGEPIDINFKYKEQIMLFNNYEYLLDLSYFNDSEISSCLSISKENLSITESDLDNISFSQNVNKINSFNTFIKLDECYDHNNLENLKNINDKIVTNTILNKNEYSNANPSKDLNTIKIIDENNNLMKVNLKEIKNLNESTKVDKIENKYENTRDIKKTNITLNDIENNFQECIKTYKLKDDVFVHINKINSDFKNVTLANLSFDKELNTNVNISKNTKIKKGIFPYNRLILVNDFYDEDVSDSLILSNKKIKSEHDNNSNFVSTNVLKNSISDDKIDNNVIYMDKLVYNSSIFDDTLINENLFSENELTNDNLLKNNNLIFKNTMLLIDSDLLNFRQLQNGNYKITFNNKTYFLFIYLIYKYSIIYTEKYSLKFTIYELFILNEFRKTKIFKNIKYRNNIFKFTEKNKNKYFIVENAYKPKIFRKRKFKIIEKEMDIMFDINFDICKFSKNV